MNFKIGDTVQLKSGGPVMTVDSVEEDGSYWCIWFANSGKDQKGSSFKGATLKPV